MSENNKCIIFDRVMKHTLRDKVDTIMAQNDVLDTAREEGLTEGLEQGREQGREEEAARIAKNMLQLGMDIKTISSLSGLSEERIQKL